MLQKGHREETVNAILEDLVRQGYLNDEEWLFRFVENKARQGYGPKMISYLLAQKKIKAPLPEIDQKAVISDFILRKQLYRKERPRLIALLLRRGFEYGHILEALKNRHDQDSVEME